MPVKSLDATLSTFDSVFEKFKSEAPNNEANLILFLADNDPSTSLSWCPDCVRAEPVIYKKLEAKSGDIAVLRAYVGDRPTWRNPQQPWRGDSRFKLTGVPTLILWENDAVKGRLEDHEAHVENKIDALVDRLEDHEAHVENKIDAPVDRLEDHEAHVENKIDAPVNRLEDHEAHVENKIDVPVDRLEDHEAHVENKIDALVDGN